MERFQILIIWTILLYMIMDFTRAMISAGKLDIYIVMVSFLLPDADRYTLNLRSVRRIRALTLVLRTSLY